MSAAARQAFVAACLVLGACSGRATEPALTSSHDSAGITIVESHQPLRATSWIISGTPLLEISGHGIVDETPLDPVSAFFDSAGRIIVGDGRQAGWHAILVYGANGEFLAKISREGQGPGEFGQLSWAAPYRGDSIAAFDFRDQRVAIFDRTGKFGREIQFPVPWWRRVTPAGTYPSAPGVYFPFADGSFLAYASGALDLTGGPGPAWYRHLLLNVPPDGSASDSIGDFRVVQAYWDGKAQVQYPFAARTSSAALDTTFLVAQGDRFEVRVYAKTGEIKRIHRRSFEPVAVTNEDRRAFVAWYLDRSRTSPGRPMPGAREQLETLVYPFYKPATSSLLVDTEGNTWLEHFRLGSPFHLATTETRNSWSVLAPTGEWIVDVALPPRFVPTQITRDRILGFVVDDADVKHVQVYALDRS